MLRIRIKRRLVSLIPTLENLLDIRSILRRVGVVQSPEGDAHWVGHGFPFGGEGVGGMGCETGGDDGDAAVGGGAVGEEASDVAPAETVAYGADAGDAEVGLHGVEGAGYDGVDFRGWVSGEPGCEVEG